MTSYATQIKSRGYDELPIITRPNKELIRIASLIEPFLQDEVKVKTMRKKEVLAESHDFLNKYFNF